jgi:hypothetical protein
MFKRYALSGAFAVLCAGAAASAQTAPPPQQQPQTQPPAMEQQATATVEGCIYREQDIAGRSPNVAERAGILEDYILVAAAPVAGTPGAAGTSGTTEPSAVPAAAPKMFKLEHEADDKLSALIGKRVKVTGKMDIERGDKTATGAPRSDASMGPDTIELPEFEVTSIAETAGECPAKPAAIRK